MSKLIHLSEATSLAFHAMALIAKSNETRLNSKQLSASISASEAHMSKVLQQLAKSNLIKSMTGPKGGFYLAKPSEEITLLEIYECIEGTVNCIGCPLSRNICPFNRCMFKGIIEKVSNELIEYFKSCKLSELTNI